MVPMRDGVKLETVIFAPHASSQPLPFLLTRSPFGVPAPDASVLAERVPKHLAKDGYIFVWQKSRGGFRSEGTFATNQPRVSKEANATDESTDAYDTIEWLLRNVPGHNGRAGMRGMSLRGWTATMALLEPHPALKAIAEIASPADQFIGDDFHFNGALKLSSCFDFAAAVESAKYKKESFPFDRGDMYDWYLALGPLSNVNDRYFHGDAPIWNDFADHPNLDEFWKRRSFDSFLKRTSVPTLNVAAWWDQEDFRGPQRIYELLERDDENKLNYFVAGPWNHHGAEASPGRKLGDIDFGIDTGTRYRENVEGPWFARWLHGRDVAALPEAQVFITGANRWQSFETWPPKQAKPTKLYFGESRKLSFAAPLDRSATFDEYVSDPANPVPYARRPIRAPDDPLSETSVWQVQDQRFVDHRPDVLSWETDVLDRDVVVAGEVVADLFASTSGSDSDWVVKLIDVFPEGENPTPEVAPSQQDQRDPPPDLRGYQLMIASNVMRGRFRKNFSRPEPVVPGRFEEYKFSLETHAHAFLKGHRIMVQVQSSWFPLIDRNPQKYVPNIFHAKEADFQRATQRIARSRGAPSAIVLPILAL
jgi:putative CocE/NonD family hydrolase